MKTEQPKRAGIYCRISLKTKDSDDSTKNPVPKVEAQEAMCRKMAEGHDLAVVKVYVDDGISAYTFKDRPGWGDLLADVQAGNLDVILAQAEDRFTRQPMEKEALALTCAAAGVTFLTVNDGAVDPATADGAFFSGIRVLMGRMESQKMGTRKRQANEARRASGVIPRGGPRPFGWQEDRTALDEDEADLIAEAYADLISENRTLSAIATAWNKAGVLTTRKGRWDIPKVQAVLRRTRNAGIVSYNGTPVLTEEGEPVEPKWASIVDAATFDAALAIMGNGDKQTKVHEAKHLCSSLAFCGECGQRMRSALNHGKPMYRCAVHSGTGHKKEGVKHVSIDANLLNEAVRQAVVSAILFAPTDAVPDADMAALAALHVKLSDLRQSEANLLDLVEEKSFSAAAVAAKGAALRGQALQAEAAIAAIAQRNARAALLVDAQRSLWSGNKVSFTKVAEAKKQIRDKFDALALGQRRALIRGMVEITVHRGRGPQRIQVKHLVATSLNKDVTNDENLSA